MSNNIKHTVSPGRRQFCTDHQHLEVDEAYIHLQSDYVCIYNPMSGNRTTITLHTVI